MLSDVVGRTEAGSASPQSMIPSQSTGHLPWRELGQYFLDLAMTYDHQDNGKFLF